MRTGALRPFETFEFPGRGSCQAVCDGLAAEALTKKRDYRGEAKKPVKVRSAVSIAVSSVALAEGSDERATFVEGFQAYIANSMTSAGIPTEPSAVLVTDIRDAGERRRRQLQEIRQQQAAIPVRHRTQPRLGGLARRLQADGGAIVDYEISVPMENVDELVSSISTTIASEVAAGDVEVGGVTLAAAETIELAEWLPMNSKIRAAMAGLPAPSRFNGGVEEFYGGLVCTRQPGGSINLYVCKW